MHCIKSLIALFILPALAFSQTKTSLQQYHVVGSNRNYLPMSIANFQNQKKWYAEGRYNYEDIRTFSLYFGKTFSREQDLSYSFTPLIGGAMGDFNGLSTGLNLDLDFRNFFFSAQSQYSLSTDDRGSNFFYNWSELAYQPLKWLYGGVSFQNTRLYKTQMSFEPGFLIGYTFKNLSVPLYTFSPFSKERYFMLGLTVEWERASKKKMGKNVIVDRREQ
jgi:hypothetical protein